MDLFSNVSSFHRPSLDVFNLWVVFVSSYYFIKHSMKALGHLNHPALTTCFIRIDKIADMHYWILCSRFIAQTMHKQHSLEQGVWAGASTAAFPVGRGQKGQLQMSYGPFEDNTSGSYLELCYIIIWGICYSAYFNDFTMRLKLINISCSFLI